MAKRKGKLKRKLAKPKIKGFKFKFSLAGKRGRLKSIRQEKVKRRKNFFPTLFAILTFWSALGFLIYFVDPFGFAIIPTFFLLLFLALLFTLSTLFINSRRGLIAAVAIVFFAILRFFGIGNIINLLLTLALALAVEYYFSSLP